MRIRPRRFADVLDPGAVALGDRRLRIGPGDALHLAGGHHHVQAVGPAAGAGLDPVEGAGELTGGRCSGPRRAVRGRRPGCWRLRRPGTG